MMRALILTLVLAIVVGLPATAQQTKTVFFEDFTTPDDGWTLGSGWAVDAVTPSNGGASGGNNLRVAGSGTGVAMSPRIDLRRLQSGTLTYVARRTNSFGQDWINIRASIDGGITYPIIIVQGSEGLPEEGGSWHSFSFELPSSLLGANGVTLMIEKDGTGTSSATARFDDFAITGDVLFDVEPPRGIFAAEVGESEMKTFVLTNYLAGSLNVGAPSLSGGPFTVAPNEPVVLLEGETQEYVLTFAPQAAGMYQETIDFHVEDGGAVTIPLTAVTSINRLSFSQSQMSAGEYETNVQVDLHLTFSNQERLNGFQTDISWDDPVLALTDVSVGNTGNGNGWTVSHSSTSTSTRILLFDDGGTGLESGSYDPILTLHFDAGLLANGDRDVTLWITDVVGALAVPTADDAELLAGSEPLVVSVEKRDADFSVAPQELAFGSVQAGESSTLTFAISNPTGERVLTITSIDPVANVFSVTPQHALIAPGTTVEFTATFSPTSTDFGYQALNFSIIHDGVPAGPHLLPVTALGTYGRGDNDGDGMVDAMDVVNIIDFVLQRETPSPISLSASDLFPFSSGDGILDIRDLTISVQGIVRGVWPDDVALPPLYDPQLIGPSKQGVPIVVNAVQDEADLVLTMATSVPVRALQLDLRIENVSGAPTLVLNEPGAPSASGRSEVDSANGAVRLLLYRPDGGAIAAGEYVFARVPRERVGAVERAYATAIDESNDRRPVEIIGLVSGPTEQAPLPDRFAVQTPYPNPFVTGSTAGLSIPVTLPAPATLRLGIYDMLGRRVFDTTFDESSGQRIIDWNGRDLSGQTVPPGIYLVSVDAGSARQTVSVVVVR